MKLSGTCWVTALDNGALRIDRADERVWVDEDLLKAISDNPPEHPVRYGDGILTIRAVNGTVSYGVGPQVAGARPGSREGIKSGI